MKQDRFLLIILGAIGLLAITAIVLLFIRRDSQTDGPDDSPEGVLRNYVIALNQEDYETAYNYLQDIETKPDYDQFREKLTSRKEQISQTAVKIISIDISGDEAKIKVALTREGTDPFEGGHSTNQTVLLVLQGDAWKLAKIPYPFRY